MTKGEKRFQDLVLTALFPNGVPDGHREALRQSDNRLLHEMSEHCRAIAEQHGVELMDDFDDPVDE